MAVRGSRSKAFDEFWITEPKRQGRIVVSRIDGDKYIGAP